MGALDNNFDAQYWVKGVAEPIFADLGFSNHFPYIVSLPYHVDRVAEPFFLHMGALWQQFWCPVLG